MANLLQHPVMTDFVYPFLLVFFILFAILEKTKIFGEKAKEVKKAEKLKVEAENIKIQELTAEKTVDVESEETEAADEAESNVSEADDKLKDILGGK